MIDDKILFLSFLFISGHDIDFVKATYQERDAWEFDRLLNWFKMIKLRLLIISIFKTHSC